MSGPSGIPICGRIFHAPDLATIRAIIGSEPGLCRREIATRVCRELGWLRPDGRLKEMSCRVALLRLQRQGLIELPPPRHGNGNGKTYHPGATLREPECPVECGVGSLTGLSLRPVTGRKDSRLWNEAVSRFHYLGYSPLPGAQMRYLVECSGGPLGAIGFGASAWKAAPRDRWIGWTEAQRRGRLHLIVNNARFLILPWVRCRNLASWVLSRCARRLPLDFEERYGYRPVLLETFVERGLFRGTCYRGANWLYLGDTQGRGKLDRHFRRGLPIKQIYVYPLTGEFRSVLCA